MFLRQSDTSSENSQLHHPFHNCDEINNEEPFEPKPMGQLGAAGGNQISANTVPTTISLEPVLKSHPLRCTVGKATHSGMLYGLNVSVN